MNVHKTIEEQVHKLYWNQDKNCATTSLSVLASLYSLELADQVIHSTKGMHGAGGYRAQCGLVEGPLMFIGIYGREKNLSDEIVIMLCHDFASAFDQEFGSLSCHDLRPGGFNDDDPQHLCEQLTIDAIKFTVDFINTNVNL